MDRFFASLEGVIEDADLRICRAAGVAWQADLRVTAAYDASYYDYYKALEDTPVARKLNAGRCAMLARHAESSAAVLDFGAGCGTFVAAARSWGYDAKGFDINPRTIEALRGVDCYADDVSAFDVLTFWDSLEHLPEAGELLRKIRRGAVVLVAIPVIEDLTRIRDSKHYKPGEHLMYFTTLGFTDWMAAYGFRILETSDHEIHAGRESIGAFAFKRDIPMRCPCGGETHVADFEWPPAKPETMWFLRCEQCGAMSEAVSDPGTAGGLEITPERAACASRS